MPSELFGTSVIFVKVAPTYVERTLTTLRAKPNVSKAEAVFGRHDIAIAGGFRNTDELRAFASEVQAWDHVRGLRSYPARPPFQTRFRGQNALLLTFRMDYCGWFK